ncbi:MAG: lactonase family protein [Bacteroidales bacterium]|nr:lactonase family protein [Bacteroidales bacterium]
MKTNHILIIYLLFLTLLLVSPVKSEIAKAKENQAECYIYVSVNKDKKIVTFKLDPKKEELVFIGEQNLAGEPGSLCTDPFHKKMYVALRDMKSVGCLIIDKKTGQLTHQTDTPVADNPVYISTDNKGKFLFFASYSGNKVAVYPIMSYGVNQNPVQVINTRLNPHMIKTDPSGSFVFVTNKGSDYLQQFVFQNNGLLKPNNPEGIVFKNGSGPRHFTFNPSKNIMYVVNELSCTVVACHFDKQKGTLTGQFQEITTKPADFKSYNTCADIHITPDGKFLYASNRGHDSLAGFSVDTITGELFPLGWFPTEKEPREFEIDPSGRFLIAAGESSGNIALYKILGNGSLSLVKTYEVGHWPVWVMALNN